MKALCVLFLAIPLAMAGEHETLCRKDSIGLSGVEPSDLFAIKDIEFTSFTDLSTADLRFVNRSGKSIDYLRILLEFRDVNNQYLMTTPIEILLLHRYERPEVPDPLDMMTNTRNIPAPSFSGEALGRIYAVKYFALPGYGCYFSSECQVHGWQQIRMVVTDLAMGTSSAPRNPR